MPDPKNPEAWMSLREALTAVTDHFGGEQAAKLAIAERIRDGELQIFADLLQTNVVLFAQGAADEFKNPGASRVFGKIESRRYRAGVVDPKYTARSGTNFDSDVAQWRWGTGAILFSWGDRPNHHKIANRMTGVKLKRKEIDSITRPQSARAIVPTTFGEKTPYIPPAPKYDWDTVYAKLIALSHDGKLGEVVFGDSLGPRGQRTEQAALERWIANEISLKSGGKQPSETEIRKRAALIIQAIRRNEL